MNNIKKPVLQWTPAELNEIPKSYAQLIVREHERAVELHKAKIAWARAEARAKAKKEKGNKD